MINDKKTFGDAVYGAIHQAKEKGEHEHVSGDGVEVFHIPQQNKWVAKFHTSKGVVVVEEDTCSGDLAVKKRTSDEKQVPLNLM